MGAGRERERESGRAASCLLVKWQKRGEPVGETAVATHVCTYTHTGQQSELQEEQKNDSTKGKSNVPSA